MAIASVSCRGLVRNLIVALISAAVCITSAAAQSAPQPGQRWCDTDAKVLLADARKGDGGAMLCMGVKYSNGSQVPRDDAQATSWFRRAADAGQPSGMFFVGVAFWSGRGVPQDMVEAYKWLDLSAKYGNDSERDRSTGARDSLARVLSSGQISDAKMRAAEWEREFRKRKKP